MMDRKRGYFGYPTEANVLKTYDPDRPMGYLVIIVDSKNGE